jgi:hypothetical protein
VAFTTNIAESNFRYTQQSANLGFNFGQQLVTGPVPQRLHFGVSQGVIVSIGTLLIP